MLESEIEASPPSLYFTFCCRTVRNDFGIPSLKTALNKEEFHELVPFLEHVPTEH
ncbi:hypothetical protein ACTXT7_013942, partial [Hymenolepis weldensis]